MNEIRDIEIIKSLQKEFNNQTFLLIYNVYFPMLKSIVATTKRKRPLYTGSFEMLMHHATIGLYDAVMKYDVDKGASFSTYAYMVIERKLQRVIRKTFQTFSKTHYSCDSLDLEVVKGNVNEPEVEYNNQKVIEALKEAGKSLDETTQKIMNYIFEYNYSYDEIADKLNLTYKQVTYKINKAKTFYKKYLKEHKELPIKNIDL